jgi:hypothetical protein
MSTLTTCNFCSLRSIRARADKDGKIVDVRPADGGLAVFVRRPEVTPDYRSPDDGNTQWVAWFMSLSDGCVC